mmetsp:Transcript_13436/g.14890  ORF Transcript_13436/g.14890 Transcript_13436/m.14890 type:complete len:86 (-) Transcript_13436:692-949(-)
MGVNWVFPDLCNDTHKENRLTENTPTPQCWRNKSTTRDINTFKSARFLLVFASPGNFPHFVFAVVVVAVLFLQWLFLMSPLPLQL